MNDQTNATELTLKSNTTRRTFLKRTASAAVVFTVVDMMIAVATPAAGCSSYQSNPDANCVAGGADTDAHCTTTNTSPDSHCGTAQDEDQHCTQLGGTSADADDNCGGSILNSPGLSDLDQSCGAKSGIDPTDESCTLRVPGGNKHVDQNKGL